MWHEPKYKMKYDLHPSLCRVLRYFAPYLFFLIERKVTAFYGRYDSSDALEFKKLSYGLLCKLAILSLTPTHTRAHTHILYVTSLLVVCLSLCCTRHGRLEVKKTVYLFSLSLSLARSKNTHTRTHTQSCQGT